MMEHDLEGPITLVTDMLAAAPIKPGAVTPVSVLKIGPFSVIVFAFDAGVELREHHAPVPVLLQVLDGCVQVEALGQTVDLVPGGLLHLAPEVRHRVVAAEPSRLQLTILGTGHDPVG
ncbi:MAG: cupin domain-containing protein [Thermomicrobiales bacterium]